MMGAAYGMPMYAGGMMNPYAAMMGVSTPTLTAIPASTVPAAPAAVPGVTAATASQFQPGTVLCGDSDGDSPVTSNSQPDMQTGTASASAAGQQVAAGAGYIGSSLPRLPAESLPSITAALTGQQQAAAGLGLQSNSITPTGTGAAAVPVALQNTVRQQGAALPAVITQQAAQAPMSDDGAGASPSGAVQGMHSLGYSYDDDPPMLDEKDLKRLRRKQSNRESARRSRLRKQAENDTLQQRLTDCEAQRSSLLAENATLKQRMEQYTLLVAKLTQDKAALIAQVRTLGGQVDPQVAGITAISTVTAAAGSTLQQQRAALAAPQAAVLPAGTTMQAGTLPLTIAAAPAALTVALPADQLRTVQATPQLASISVAAGQPAMPSNAGVAEAPSNLVSTAILASA
eukprot:GHRR01022281.1.p1 GENE.GHRR01022281.1~~GHRR01022281.1.p1  ORF type:complete len:401 (+),score=161.93 GHRR01022281.1:767-1969(+)